MKSLIIIAGFAVLVGLAAMSSIFGKDIVVVSERSTATTTEEIVVEEVDVIDAAKAELERINHELDVEEQKLIKEIEERETRLESIRETRMSFQ